MHSSKMCTARLLTVSQHALGRGVYPSIHWAGAVCPGGCVCLGGVCPGVSTHGMSAQGCVWQIPLPPCEQNDRQV